MRHLKTGRKFGRKSATRKALFKDLSISLIEHEAIKTTLPRRLAFSKIRSKSAVGKLFSVIGPRFKERPGGYLRIIKMMPRAGDAAPMAFIELVSRTEQESIEEAE